MHCCDSLSSHRAVSWDAMSGELKGVSRSLSGKHMALGVDATFADCEIACLGYQKSGFRLGWDGPGNGECKQGSPFSGISVAESMQGLG